MAINRASLSDTYLAAGRRCVARLAPMRGRRGRSAPHGDGRRRLRRRARVARHRIRLRWSRSGSRRRRPTASGAAPTLQSWEALAMIIGGGVGFAAGAALVGIGMGRWTSPRPPESEADYTGPGDAARHARAAARRLSRHSTDWSDDHADLDGHDQHLARRDGDRDRRADAADDRHRRRRVAGDGQGGRGGEGPRGAPPGAAQRPRSKSAPASPRSPTTSRKSSTRVRRADDAVRAQLDRFDSAAHVAGHAIGAKVWPVVGLSRAVGAAFKAFTSRDPPPPSSPGTPHVAGVTTR